jgi:hypothetical protein
MHVHCLPTFLGCMLDAFQGSAEDPSLGDPAGRDAYQKG